jgi:hypothetical protein
LVKVEVHLVDSNDSSDDDEADVHNISDQDAGGVFVNTDTCVCVCVCGKT